MFGVTPAFQGEEEDLPRSRSASLNSSRTEISPRRLKNTIRDFTIVGDQAIIREEEKPEGIINTSQIGSRKADPHSTQIFMPRPFVLFCRREERSRSTLQIHWNSSIYGFLWV